MKEKLAALPSSFSAFKEYAADLLDKHPSNEDDGTLLIGNDTSVAPLYYKAIIWPPISRHAIARYEQINEMIIPPPIKALLSIANGFEVLGLRVCGLSKSMLNDIPTIDRTAKHRCLDLSNNKSNSIRKKGYFFFACSHWSKSENVKYFVTPENEYIALLDNGKQVGHWHTLELFISSAISQAIEYKENPIKNTKLAWWKLW
jgi:hypothetical protein